MSGTNEHRVVNADTGGAKGSKDQRFELLPWGALSEVSALYAKGAEKYADHNWRKGYAWSLSAGALGRHYAAFMEGEDVDTETGCHHMTSVVFHALALLEFARKHPELDDRPGADSEEVDFVAWQAPDAWHLRFDYRSHLEASGWDTSFRSCTFTSFSAATAVASARETASGTMVYKAFEGPDPGPDAPTIPRSAVGA